jgi:hypothetical protein
MSQDTSDRKFLKEKGAATHVIQGGLAGLVEAWGKVVSLVQQGYPYSLDDYMNDLDGRQLLEETLAIIPEEERKKNHKRLQRADELMRTLVRPVRKCLWGESVARSEGWTREKNWWYFSRPIQAPPELFSDIEDL